MNLVDVLAKYIRPYYYYIITLVMLILFIIISYYAYQQLYAKNQNKFKDVANADRRGKEAVIMFFHADWCPHCKKADPEWKTFMSQNDGKEINGYIIKCSDINCTDDTNSRVAELINQYGIKSYPTIKMIKDEQVIEFDSKITNTSLESFVQTMLNQ